MANLFPLDLQAYENDQFMQGHLLAFKDFCLDLIEEEYGRIPPEEEIDLVKGLLIRT